MENSTLLPTIANAVNNWFDQVLEKAQAVRPRSIGASVLPNRTPESQACTAPKATTELGTGFDHASDSVVLCMEDGPVIVLYGALSESNYTTLIQQALSIYAQGYRQITVDLYHCNNVKLSGLFALLSIHTIFCGETPPDPQDGLNSLRQMVTRIRTTGIVDEVYFKNATGNVADILVKNGLLPLPQ